MFPIFMQCSAVIFQSSVQTRQIAGEQMGTVVDVNGLRRRLDCYLGPSIERHFFYRSSIHFVIWTWKNFYKYKINIYNFDWKLLQEIFHMLTKGKLRNCSAFYGFFPPKFWSMFILGKMDAMDYIHKRICCGIAKKWCWIPRWV